MATARVIHYSGSTELNGIHPVKSDYFKYIKAIRNDGYSRLAGHPITGPDAIMAVTRIIHYKKNPSLHKCDSRCMNATGHNCECSCGGSNHGINARG